MYATVQGGLFGRLIGCVRVCGSIKYTLLIFHAEENSTKTSLWPSPPRTTKPSRCAVCSVSPLASISSRLWGPWSMSGWPVCVPPSVRTQRRTRRELCTWCLSIFRVITWPNISPWGGSIRRKWWLQSFARSVFCLSRLPSCPSVVSTILF